MPSPTIENEPPTTPSKKEQQLVSNTNNWRQYHHSPSSKLYYLLTNNLHTDVTFCVGGTDIPCHRLVLCASSPVFEAMLTGPLKETEEVISIPDVSPDAWWVMLEFLYTRNFSATMSTAVDVMYVCQKYDIPELTTKCSELLKTDLTEHNAVTIYQAAQLLEDKELEERAEIWIVKNLFKVLHSRDFLNLTKENLKHFFAKDEIDVPELELFQGIIRWAKGFEDEDDEENSDNSSSSTSTSSNDTTTSESSSVVETKKVPTQPIQRLVVPVPYIEDDLLNLIRFPLMSAEEFSLYVVPTQLLDLQHCVWILQHLTVTKDKRSTLPPLRYNCSPRSVHAVYTAHFAIRLTDMVYPYVSHIMYYDSFEVDTPITLFHLGFPSPDIDNAVYDIAVQIQVHSTPGTSESSNALVAQTTQHALTGKRRGVMRVSFGDGVKLDKNVLYKVIYKLKGHDTYYADQRADRFPVRRRDGKGVVNFKFVAYSCRLIEIGFGF